MGPTFEDFFRAEYESVRRALIVALRDADLAENAAQEGFVAAFARWSRVSRMDNPAGWVFVAAVRYARRRRPDLLAEADVAVADPADTVAIAHDLAVLIDELPPRQRLAVVLRFVADLSVAQVADAMGCAVGTAKATLHAALGRLRVEITEEEAAHANG
jgi:RNA polymerase sigma-70 factor (ECF subfamily)